VVDFCISSVVWVNHEFLGRALKSTLPLVVGFPFY